MISGFLYAEDSKNDIKVNEKEKYSYEETISELGALSVVLEEMSKYIDKDTMKEISLNITKEISKKFQ